MTGRSRRRPGGLLVPLAAVAAVGLCVALVLWRAEPERRLAEAVPRGPAIASATERPAGEADPAAAALAPTSPPSLPASLAGTEVDGALQADAAGRFVATPSALRLFDYFLSASGEEDPARIRARIEAEIERQLPPSAQADARALLEMHLQYREAVRALAAEGLADDDLETRHQRLREQRRASFGAALAGDLFEAEEQMARVALAMRRVDQDPELSPEEKRARREALAEELPESVRAANRRAAVPLELSQREAELRAEGASPGALRELRESLVGGEAANRLEALEAQRNAWNGRLEAYRLERDLLLRGPEGASDEALEHLRELHFDGTELARVRALDRIEGTASDEP